MASEEKNNNTQTVIIIGAALLLWDKLVGKSEDEKKAEEEAKKLLNVPQEKNPTLENFKVPAKKGYAVMRKNIGTVLGPNAATIKKAIGNGYFVGMEEQSTILTALKKCITKTEMNILFRTYSALYKRDLLTDLQANLYPVNLEKAFAYINTLPNYIKL